MLVPHGVTRRFGFEVQKLVLLCLLNRARHVGMGSMLVVRLWLVRSAIPTTDGPCCISPRIKFAKTFVFEFGILRFGQANLQLQEKH